MESPCTLPMPSGNSDDGWNEDGMDESEKEVGLALVEQVELSPGGSPNFPCPPCSVEASQDES